MINKDYFYYLIKNHKRHLLLIYLAGFILIPFYMYVSKARNILNQTYRISMAFGLILAFIIPVYLYSFVQKKNSAIFYFSLPIKRKKLYFTRFLFSLFASIIPVVLYDLMAVIIFASKSQHHFKITLLPIVVIMIYMFVMICVVTYISLLCQNLLDSVIVNLMYMIVPFIVYICTRTYLYNLSYEIMDGFGNYIEHFDNILRYFSLPVSGYIELNIMILQRGNVHLLVILIWIIFAFICLYAGYHTFKKRAIDDCEKCTRSVLIYPAMILFITFSLMLIVYEPVFHSDQLMLYGLIFILFLIMLFFSKRKIEFNWKAPVIYIVLIVFCMAFSNAFLATKGFGTLSEYPDIDQQTSFEMMISLNGESFDQDVAYLTAKGYNHDTAILMYEFHKKLFEEDLITPYREYDDFEEDTIDLYIVYKNNEGESSRNYVITGTEDVKRYLELYNVFISNPRIYSEVILY